MQPEKVLNCARCGKKTPLNLIRADTNAKDWICLTCYEIQHKKLKRTSLEDKPSYLRLNKKLKQIGSEVKVKLRCSKCNHSFSASSNSIPKICPNCGKNETIKLVPSSTLVVNK